jgi:hypothetical protein
MHLGSANSWLTTRCQETRALAAVRKWGGIGSQYLVGPELEQLTYDPGINPDGDCTIITSTGASFEAHVRFSEPTRGYAQVLGPELHDSLDFACCLLDDFDP